MNDQQHSLWLIVIGGLAFVLFGYFRGVPYIEFDSIPPIEAMLQGVPSVSYTDLSPDVSYWEYSVVGWVLPLILALVSLAYMLRGWRWSRWAMWISWGLHAGGVAIWFIVALMDDGSMALEEASHYRQSPIGITSFGIVLPAALSFGAVLALFGVILLKPREAEKDTDH